MFLNPLKILIFLFLDIYANTSTNDCYTYLIGETPVSYPCGSPGSFSPSSLNLQSPYKQLTISLSIKPTDFCSMTSDFNFLTVSILPASSIGGQIKRVMMLTYLVSSKSIVVQSEDLTGFKTAVSIGIIDQIGTPMSFLNNPANLYMSVNLSPGSNSFTGGGIAGAINNAPEITTVNYGSDWVFDSTLNVAVCSDYGGANSIGCTVQDLKVFYSYYSHSSILTFANQVKIIGDYKLDDDQTGNTLANSQRPLNAITLPSTQSPNWIPEGGLDFTSANQYFQFSGLTPSALDLTITTSIGFAFYLKIDAASTSSAPLYIYYCSQLQTVIFQSMIAPSMKVQSVIDTAIAEAPTALTIGQWNMIYMAYSYTYGGTAATYISINGFSIVAENFKQNVFVSSHLSPSDAIIFGGFVGKLRRMQIYSPATYQLDHNVCDPTNCAVNLGFSNPPTCLQAICTTPGSYVSFGSCEQCPTGCSTCNDATTCQSCKIGYYSDSGTTCKNCPLHCYSCTGSQTCQVCDSGYGFFNNICVLCPSRTYLTYDGFCKQFSQTIQDTLTTSQLINSGGAQASNLISKGRSISLSAAVSGKIFSQIKYLNISYSGELEIALKTWLSSFVSLGLTPNMPNSALDKIPERHVPYVFQKYDVSSSFLINFWENVGVIIFTTILWVLLKILELRLTPKKAWLPRKARIMVQNFLIAALYGVYGDLILFSIIEYRTIQFGWNLSLLSFLISVTLLIMMCMSFFFQIRLLLNYQKLKKQDSLSSNDAPKLLQKFTKDHEGSQVLFKDFKDYSLAPQLFLFLLSGRDLAFSFLLATMFEYSLAQTLIITILDCLMIVYLFIKRPFKNSFDAAQQYFFEAIALIVNVTVLINAVLDAGKYEAFQARKNIGHLIIVANMIFNFVTAIFMLISIAQALREFYKEQKEKRAKKRKTINMTVRLQRPRPPQENLHKTQTEQTLIQESLVSDQSLESLHHQESSSLNLLLPPTQLPICQRRSRKINIHARVNQVHENIGGTSKINDNPLRIEFNSENLSQVNQPRNKARREYPSRIQTHSHSRK